LYVRVPALAVATAFACAIAGLGAAAGGARTLAPGTLRVEYIRSSSLQFQDTNGNPVTSIAAGSYQVVVDDPDDPNPSFNMSGPGVSLSNNNLDSSGMGIDRPAFFGPFNFQAGASYTASDTNMGGSSAISLSVTSGGGSSGGGTTTGGSTGVTTTQSTGSGSRGKTTLTGGHPVIVGILAGTVSATGKVTLVHGGKTVTKLKAGRYTLKIVDHSKSSGLVVEKLGFPAMTESASTKIGTSSHTLTLSSGRWFFASSAHSKKTYFNVT
jgi:hypothetical protein